MTKSPWKAVRAAITPPSPDETFSSVVERAAAFWDLGRSELIGSWMPNDAAAADAVEADAPTPELSAALAYTIGVKEESLQPTIVGNGDWVVAPGRRVAYCPLCWEEDAAQGRDPYFRRSWCSLAAVQCEHHAVPLRPWLQDARGGRRGPPARHGTHLCREIWLSSVEHARSWLEAPSNQYLRDVLSKVSTFSTQAISVLQGEEFPAQWRGDAQTLKDLIVLLTTNPAPFAERIPLDRLVPSVPDETLFGGQRRAAAPAARREGWKGVRQLGSPQVRRTLWWLIGRTIVPQWKPLPTYGVCGLCHDAQTWWKRRIEMSISAHSRLGVRSIASRLGLGTHEQMGDLFAA
jgi:hypothetical protein